MAGLPAEKRALQWKKSEKYIMAKGKYHEWLKEDNLILLRGWARDGLTDEQIAHNIGIGKNTFYEWKKKYKDFADALKKGKEVIDYIVENALIKRLSGYDEWEVVEDWDREIGEWIPRTRKRKHIPADTTALIFWLKNRRPDKWRDRPVHVETEAYEDDGLIKALSETIDEDMVDDSDFLPDEDGDV